MNPGRTPRSHEGPPGFPSAVGSRAGIEGNAVLTALRQLQEAKGLTPEAATRLATGAATAFLARTASGQYLGDAITALCELATLEDAALARIGVNALFPDRKSVV